VDPELLESPHLGGEPQDSGSDGVVNVKGEPHRKKKAGDAEDD
jgi:hypothetical protein